jgi:hypothetical protein
MTIPATNSKLLITEDWKKIYQSLKNAEFQSYDFETIRRILISYLQEKYPEDFNDFIDSSEYIALVDLIAYIGQNLSFRVDLNARENFIETAQRRDSILRLAQLVGYAPRRNVPASGLLKITAISTTDNVYDSVGVNLANTTIAWNDATNVNWYDQFTAIINSAMPGSMIFGKPSDSAVIGGIQTDQYYISSTNVDVPIFSFLKGINGTSMSFEIVPATFNGQTTIYETAPQPGASFSLVYQNDNQGSGSSNTGYFVLFKQGTLALSTFSISNPVPNEIIGINVSDINNTDVWLWQLNADGSYPDTPWTQVPSLIGNNVIYNSISNSIRNIYSVTSRDNDQIDLNFADGSFGNLPNGNFSLYYRQSNGLTYVIKPEQFSGITVTIPYTNKSGQNQNLTITLALQYTVSNSAGTESNTNIQLNAPQTYYIQNRMVTGEDYNIAPLTLTTNVLKVKSINRVSSGVSKYYELSDVSAKYSSTNIVGTDGVIYKDSNEKNFSFSFSTRNDIYRVIKNQLEPIVALNSFKNFYLDNYRASAQVTLNTGDQSKSIPDYQWNLSNTVAGQGRGYFYSTNRNFFPNVVVPQSVGPNYVGNVFKYIVPGCLIKFVPPNNSLDQPQYFLPNGKIVSNQTSKTRNYIWATVIQVIGDGANTGLGNLSDGTGPIILGNPVASGAIPVEIIPAFISSFDYTLENDLVNQCLTQTNFGLRFDSNLRTWLPIDNTNIDLVSPFSLTNQGDSTGNNLDSSWMIAFIWSGYDYTVRYRLSDFIFQSLNQTGFASGDNNLNYDATTNSVIKDKITILSINTQAGLSTPLGIDYIFQIDGSIVEFDGYIDPSKVEISSYSNEDSGLIELIIDPDSFNNVVGSYTNGTNDGYVMFQIQSDGQTLQYVSNDSFIVFDSQNSALTYFNNVLDTDYLYYFLDSEQVFNATISSTFEYNPQYVVFSGRSDLTFRYQHNSGEDYRIDPSKTNIIDVYMLTADYDSQFRNWLVTGSGSEPLAPSSNSLENNYSSVLEPIKSISDEIVYQPVQYKVLFGPHAPVNLQATFKAVRNSSSTTSDNDIISRILDAINNFFSLENWDFGQSFYFSELSTYVMNLLTPDITNFVIVPTVNNFGSLYEVACQSNEIFISGATASNIEVIDAITASRLNTTFSSAG